MKSSDLLERQIVCYQVPAFEIALARLGEARIRTRPVAIAPPGPRAVIKELSSEARDEGLTIGMSVSAARRLCPSLHLLASEVHRLKLGEGHLLGVAQQYAPVWETPRPGMMLLELTGTRRLFGPALDTGVKIERELADRYGLPGVIGVGTNRFVAELASGLLQPIQAYDVWPGGEAQFVSPLSLEHLPIHHAPDAQDVRQRLADLHIQRFRDLAVLPFSVLELAFAHHARRLAQWARGEDPSPLRLAYEQPSVIRERTISPDAIDQNVVEGHLYTLLEDVCATLRKQGRGTQTLTLTIEYGDHRRMARRGQLPRATCWEVEAWPTAQDLLRKAWQRRVRLRALALAARSLAPIVEQLSLFSLDGPAGMHVAKHKRLAVALDDLKRRFGSMVVKWGGSTGRGEK